MSRLLSVAPLTAISLPRTDFIRAGFEAVGLHLPGTAAVAQTLDAGAPIPGPSAAGTDAASGFSPAGGHQPGPGADLRLRRGPPCCGGQRMSRLLSVTHLTAISLPPPDFIHSATRTLHAGAPTPGPCAGTNTASAFSPAGGINPGPALTFGFIAGRQAAGANA